MFPFKAIGFGFLLLWLLPWHAFGHQNGSKIPSKTPQKPSQKATQTTQSKPVAPKAKTSSVPAAIDKTKPAATKAKTDNKTAPNKKNNMQPASPELQKFFTDLLKNKQQKEENTLSYEIDGLLIDETLTKTGHDFYDVFYSAWEAPEQVNNYTVRIIERPLRGRGFQIIVSVNDVEIIEENLQPRYDMLEAAAQNAVETTRDYLLNYENLKNQIDTDDQHGTGLF